MDIGPSLLRKDIGQEAWETEKQKRISNEQKRERPESLLIQAF